MSREKVIKGLECHRIDNNHRINCADCPYCVNDDNHINCVNDLHDDAIALLKEQEAVSVDVCGQMFTVKYGHCPKCNEGLNSEVYPHWCGFCGQAVKWE